MTDNNFRPLIPVNPQGLDDIAESLLNNSSADLGSSGQVFTNARINPREYLQVPNTNVLISYLESLGYNGLNWEKTHFKLAENGLFMPTPKIFMDHFLNVLKAKEGKSNLYYADGKEVERNNLDYLYNHLTKDHIAAYESQGGSRKGVWTWLDALFKEENGQWTVETNHRVQNKKLISSKFPLDACIGDDCFVELEFNKQGLATKKTGNQKYLQGKNIRYWYPRNGAVTRFDAGSGRAGLDCGGDPASADSSLGVFACAKNLGVKNGK